MKKKLKHKYSKEPVSFEEQYGAGGPVNGYIKDPQTALEENAQLWQQAMGMADTSPLANILDLSVPLVQAGASMLSGSEAIFGESKLGKKDPTAPVVPTAAAGMSTTGKRVTLEGGEILENPKGDILKIKGPRHEKGGVTLDLPMNSEDDNYNIYSDRIEGKTGKTLAKEKEGREKKIAKYQKHIQKYPGDIAAKNTLERLIKSSKLADVNAVNLQKEIRETAQLGSADINIPEENAAPAPQSVSEEIIAASGVSLTGGRDPYDPSRVDLLDEEEYLLGTDPPTMEELVISVPRALKQTPQDVMLRPQELPDIIRRDIPTLTGFQTGVATPEAPDLPGMGRSSYTPGDMIGALGMIQQGMAAKKGAAANLASYQPESNKYKNYGRGAVEALQGNQSITDREYQRNIANNELEAFKNASNIDTSSRGIGSKMANLVALQQISNKANMVAEDNYADKSIKNNADMAKVLQDINDKYLEEEIRVQDNNEKSLDAATQGVTQANVNSGKMLSYLGKIINSKDERDMTRNAINAQNLKGYYGSDGKYHLYPTDRTPQEKITPTENKNSAEKSIKEDNPITGEAQSTAVTPTDASYLTGDKVLDSFNLGAEKDHLVKMLQDPKVNIKLDLSNPESIKELQKKIGNKGGNISGKFGALTYENLKRYLAGEDAIQRHSGTGIGVVKK